VRAFNELVAEKGHSGLTVQEIAERATINRATFYAHFTDQYELFDYVISEAFLSSVQDDGEREAARRGRHPASLKDG
jgi:AcrR family transcriptional regulator